ncbi:IS1 family transposase (plasmid) [Phormidium sp. CLA17]|nr:IS1 family transposase [Leptolyngbya sp. Cla-17]
MVLEPILCPTCGSNDVVKHGQSGEGKQRYKCRNSQCSRSTFIRDYRYRGYLPEVKRQIAGLGYLRRPRHQRGCALAWQTLRRKGCYRWQWCDDRTARKILGSG